MVQKAVPCRDREMKILGYALAVSGGFFFLHQLNLIVRLLAEISVNLAACGKSLSAINNVLNLMWELPGKGERLKTTHGR